MMPVTWKNPLRHCTSAQHAEYSTITLDPEEAQLRANQTASMPIPRIPPPRRNRRERRRLAALARTSR